MARGLHGADLTIPMWLANRGLITRGAELTFEEMGFHVKTLADLAETLQDPALAAEKYAHGKAELDR